MKLKHFISIAVLFLVSSGIWGAYLMSRRAFLADFNAGVHAYLTGNFLDAEQSLEKALDRRPRNDEAKQLLLKVLIEKSFSQYHHEDYAGALQTLSQAAQVMPGDDQTRQSLTAIRDQISIPPAQRPMRIERVLGDLYKRLPEREQPGSLESLMGQWLHRSQMSQEAGLKRFWDNQEQWLIQLQKEKNSFKKILYGGLALFGLAGAALLTFLIGVLQAYFGRRGVFTRLLEDHYRRLVAALPAGTQTLLGPPVSLHSVPETVQLDAIEAEIVSGHNAEESHRRLELLLEGENPWVRARAAKVLYRLNPKLSIEELKRLVADTSADAQISGMWALAELATPDALDLIAPLAYSPIREIQQGAVRSLLQLQTKEGLSKDVHLKLNQLLSGIRSRTGWIF